jgi:hypothetical protein
MATRLEVKGAFSSLSDTLYRGNSPFFSQDMAGAWTGVGLHMSEVGRRLNPWVAAGGQSPSYDGVKGALEHASSMVAAADNDAERFAALDNADAALDQLVALIAQG